MTGKPFKKQSVDSVNWLSAAASKKRCDAANTTKNQAKPIAAPASERNAEHAAHEAGAREMSQKNRADALEEQLRQARCARRRSWH